MDGRKNNGGARANSGRKPKIEKFETAIQIAEQRCSDKLPERIDMLEQLADGGLEQISEEFAAAGTVTFETVEITTDSEGGERANRVKKQLFPDKDPLELVLIKRTITYTAPNVAANTYLANRVMGVPASADDVIVQEKVDDALSAWINLLQTNLPPSLWKEVAEVIGFSDEEDSETASAAA